MGLRSGVAMVRYGLLLFSMKGSHRRATAMLCVCFEVKGSAAQLAGRLAKAKSGFRIHVMAEKRSRHDTVIG